MKDFAGRIAVVTGGGTGMGRELVRQLVADGASVAMCDVSGATMAETKALCETTTLRQGLRITTHLCDVSDARQVQRFRDEVATQQETDHIHLLFNNAGIGGGGSIVSADARREEWEKTFNVCWGGVYEMTRAFMPMLVKADAGHLVNTSSVNGFWASVGPNVPHTAYSAAKFAVKGFSEALIADLRVNAPHVKVSVVMPGHIGTAIVTNSRKILAGNDKAQTSTEEIAYARSLIKARGGDPSGLSDEQVTQLMADVAKRFVDNAPTTAAQAATIILDGVKADRWRILVGEDAHKLDAMVRETPERAYEVAFFDEMAERIGWRLGR